MYSVKEPDTGTPARTGEATITLEVDGVSIYEAAYGTTRADTAGVCGDANRRADRADRGRPRRAGP